MYSPPIANCLPETNPGKPNTFRHAWQFALFGPIIGDALFAIGYTLFVFTMNPVQMLLNLGFFPLALLIFGLVLAHILGGIPALLTGAALYNRWIQPKWRIWLAGFVGGLTTAVWCLPLIVLFDSNALNIKIASLAVIGGLSAIVMVRFERRINAL